VVLVVPVVLDNMVLVLEVEQAVVLEHHHTNHQAIHQQEVLVEVMELKVDLLVEL
jgi:hypothetical protein